MEGLVKQKYLFKISLSVLQLNFFREHLNRKQSIGNSDREYFQQKPAIAEFY